MLEILRCRRPEEKQVFFEQFCPQSGAWVVPDLQSKWHLQKDLLRRQGVLEQASVWRSTELWSHLSFQLHPDLRVLTPELAQTLFWNWIEQMQLPWARSPQAVRVVLQQMRMWMSAFADPRHPEIMSEWFQAHGEAYVRWGHWFELCAEIWRRCQEQGWVMAAWLPSVLLASDLSRLRFDRHLVFDLGPQVTLPEAQLLRELGRNFDVRVIYPEAPWVSLMSSVLRPYDDLLPEPFKGDPQWQPAVQEGLAFGRFSTQLAEVKDAVARVRQWLEAGVAADKIAVVAPDIEIYWPALRLYFEQEGIPVAKPSTARLGGFVELSQWVSALRTALGRVSSRDLEVMLFAGKEPGPLSFDEFRVLFTHIFDARDLERARSFFSDAQSTLPAQPVGLPIFLAWAVRFWSVGVDPERLYALLQITGKEVPAELELLPAQWLSYLEGLLARREVALKRAEEDGVSCVSLSSADWLPATHAIFLNLCESALRSQESSPVAASEAQQVFTDTGFAVASPDRQEHEFELLWFLQRQWRELRLTFAGTDFSGRVLTPSKFWMWAAFSNSALKHAPEAPARTRWDEIQRLPLADQAVARAWSEGRIQAVKVALERDLDAEVSSWKPSSSERLSASGLERYAECPFLFAAERKLKLSDEPVLDLDLDRRTRGRLLHALAERLAEEPFRFERSDEELEQLIEECRVQQNIRMGDERLWGAVKGQHLRLARLFLSFEREWRTRFPNTRTLGREVAFACSWDLLEGQPTAQVGSIKLSGRLDRVDVDSQGRYALIDYKAGASGLCNWKTWLAKDELQLGLYSELLERGLAGVPAGEVMAANYYVIKDSDRRKGFHLRQEDAELYSCDDRHMNFISADEKQELFKGLRVRIQDLALRVCQGQFQPRPKEERTCNGCAWRKLCRAPHLN